MFFLRIQGEEDIDFLEVEVPCVWWEWQMWSVSSLEDNGTSELQFKSNNTSSYLSSCLPSRMKVTEFAYLPNNSCYQKYALFPPAGEYYIIRRL